MTSWSRTAIPATMLRAVWLLILSLLAASLVATATVHAQESYGSAELSCSGEVHSEGDGDQAPADADQPVPHHHGACHGHGLTAPAASPALPIVTAARDAPDASTSARLARHLVAPALKPPRG